MTRLDVLLNELCPDGVPFKRLEECCILEKGNTPIQKAIPGEYPLVVTTNERKSSNTFQFDQPSVCVPLVSSRGHGVACLNQVYYQEGRFALGNILCAVTPLKESGLSAKFLYYYLNLKKDTLIVPLMKGGANVSLTVNSLKKVKVAIPPLSVQNEIVERLQTFETLLDTLSAELVVRRKQYKYYSQQLFEEYKKESRKVPISALGKWQGGKTPSMQEKRFWENGSIPWISSKDMKAPVLSDTEDHITEAALSEASMNLLPEENVAIVTRSGILKHTFPVAFVPFRTTVNQDIKALSVADGVSARYVSFALQAYGEDIRTKTKKQGGTVDSLDFQKVLDYQIPLPDYDVQLRIVNVLENFEAICNDLKIGLPAEIEARQKQYEYYRDLLLTFAETGNTLATDRQTDRLK